LKIIRGIKMSEKKDEKVKDDAEKPKIKLRSF
jgi:hypothetical protein